MKKYPHIGARTEILTENALCMNAVIGARIFDPGVLMLIDAANGMFFKNIRNKLFLIVFQQLGIWDSVILEIPVYTSIQGYSIPPITHSVQKLTQVFGPFSKDFENMSGEIELNFSRQEEILIGLGRLP